MMDWLTRILPQRQAKTGDPLADLPLMTGGCFSLRTPRQDDDAPLREVAALLSATQTYQSRSPDGDCVFLVGLESSLTAEFFPQAQTLVTDEALDGFRLAPASYGMLLRLLYGENELLDNLHDLLLIEMLGLDTPKPIALPMLPEWIKHQLHPDTLRRILTHPMSNEQTVGAALKALRMHDQFRFALLDDLPSVSQHIDPNDTQADWHAMDKSLSPDAAALFRKWQKNAQRVVERVEALVKDPPQEIFVLAQLQRCIESGGTWIIPEHLTANVLRSLHVMGMSHGLRHRNHWLINVAHPAYQEQLEASRTSLERFAVQLWQNDQARLNGFGPSLWINWDGAPFGTLSRRLLHATQGTLGNLATLRPLLEADEVARGIQENDKTPDDPEMDGERPGLYEAATGQFRHLHDQELGALTRLTPA